MRHSQTQRLQKCNRNRNASLNPLDLATPDATLPQSYICYDGQNGDFSPTPLQLNLGFRIVPLIFSLEMDWQQPSNPLTRKTSFRTIARFTEASNHNLLGKLHYTIFELLIPSTMAVL